jgi:hypothetical protein
MMGVFQFDIGFLNREDRQDHKASFFLGTLGGLLETGHCFFGTALMRFRFDKL